LSKLQGDLSAAKPVTAAALGGGKGLRSSATSDLFDKALKDADRNLGSAFEAAEKNVAALEKSTGGVATHTQSAESAAKGLWVNLVGASAAAAALSAISYKIHGSFSQLLNLGSRIADEWEVVRIEIEQLTGSTKIAGDMMDRLVKFSLDSGMAVPQLYELSRGMIDAKYTAGQVDATLRMLMDAAGGNAQRFQTLAMTLKRLDNGGMSAGRSFMRLRAQGIISARDLATYFKTTEKNLVSILKNKTAGDLTRFLKWLTGEGGKMHGAFKKASQSSAQLSAQLQRNIELFANDVWAGINDWASAFVKVTTNLVKIFTAMPSAFKKAVGFFLLFGAASALATAVVLGLTVAIVGLTATLVAAFELALPLALAISGIAAAAVILTPILIGLYAALFSGMGGFDILMAAWTGLTNAWNYFISVLERGGVFRVFNNLLDIWDRVIDTVGLVASALMDILWPAIERIGNVIDKSLVQGISAVMSPLEKMTAWFLDAIEWLQVYAEIWRETWTSNKDVIAFMFSSIVDVIGNAMNLMIDGIKVGISKLIDMAVKAAAEIAVLSANIAAKGLMPKFAQDALRQRLMGALQPAADVAKEKMGLNSKSGVKSLTQQSDLTKVLSKLPGMEKFVELAWGKKRALEANRRNNRKPEDVPEKEGFGGITEKGQYGIGDFGKMIQDAFLKQEDKTDSILNYGNTLQEKQLEQTAMMQQTLEQGLGLV
jgi:hypothetical protein